MTVADASVPATGKPEQTTDAPTTPTTPTGPADARAERDGAREDAREDQPETRLPDEDIERWRLVVVAGVSLELPSAHPEVLLRESITPYREIRIPVGLPEGTAIAHAWRGIETPRPLTHELITDVLKRHGITIEAARITGRRGQLFYAELDTMGPRGRQVIPCRPSDAIALVLRQQLPTPLLVTEDVLTGNDAS